jgi:hypothetical protein
MAVRVVSTAATASTTGPPVGPMVGASAIAAAAASSCSAVATLRGFAGFCTSAVGMSRQLGSSTVAAEVSTATCSFVVAVPDGGAAG